MPLHNGGEAVEGLPDEWTVVPTSRWSSTYLWEEARQAAIKAFGVSGALWPIVLREEDCIVQEYTQHGKLVFLFARDIAGKKHYYPYVFDLPPAMTSALRLSGMWGKPH